MNQKVLLNPEQISATYDSYNNQLTIEASGREDGVQNIHIEQIAMALASNEFMIIGEQSAAIGNFPYSVKNSFTVLSYPKTITIKTTSGDKQVAVEYSNQSPSTQNLESNSSAKCGLFLAQYSIYIPNAMGAPLFNLFLTVNTPSGTVTGGGNITQTTNPPLNLGTKLDGNFTYMTVMPKQTSILVTATGVPAVNWSPNAGIGPVLLPNVELRMVLDGNWQSGTANYKYLNSCGEWNSINNAKVQIINTNSSNQEQSAKHLESLA